MKCPTCAAPLIYDRALTSWRCSVCSYVERRPQRMVTRVRSGLAVVGGDEEDE